MKSNHRNRIKHCGLPSAQGVDEELKLLHADLEWARGLLNLAWLAAEKGAELDHVFGLIEATRDDLRSISERLETLEKPKP